MAFRYAIALTGGIATGKSTVASLLKLHGLRVIDADAIVHQLLDDNAPWVAHHFGNDCVDKNKVKRSELGKIIFHSKSSKEKLESFIHPLVRDEIKIRSEVQDAFEFPYLIDIPLFFENSAYPITHSVVVYTPKPVQIERFMKRNAIERDEAIKRIELQMDIEEKKKLATWVIDNSGSLRELQAECERFVDTIKKIKW